MTNWSQYGKVEKSSSINSNSFIFSVTQDYLAEHKDSAKDEKNHNISKAELRLLKKLLKQERYCVNKKGKIDFRITSRQEKIYDMTFAHLIEKSYNMRPVAPRMYYGRCIDNKVPVTDKEIIKKLQDELGKLN